MVVNLIKTAKLGKFIANEEAEAPALLKEELLSKEKPHRFLEK